MLKEHCGSIGLVDIEQHDHKNVNVVKHSEQCDFQHSEELRATNLILSEHHKEQHSGTTLQNNIMNDLVKRHSERLGEQHSEYYYIIFPCFKDQETETT